MKLIIQIPCFNEAKTLPATLADLPRDSIMPKTGYSRIGDSVYPFLYHEARRFVQSRSIDPFYYMHLRGQVEETGPLGEFFEMGTYYRGQAPHARPGPEEMLLPLFTPQNEEAQLQEMKDIYLKAVQGLAEELLYVHLPGVFSLKFLQIQCNQSATKQVSQMGKLDKE